MSSLKLRKIAKIVKEINIDPSQTRYDIAGLTLGLCKFFYRTPQNLFQDLNIGDYTIDTSNNSQVLVIQNNELLRIMEAVQVCYILDITSSKYETDFNVDINQLKDEYNNLVDDVHALWDYIKKVGIVADDTSIPLILPQLNTDEVWVKTEDGYKGISLTDAEGIIKGVIEEYTSLMEKRLDAYVEDPLKPRLNEHVETVNKPELDRYVEETNKPALDDYTTQLEERLQTMIDQAVADKGLMPEGSDWLEIGLGNWLVVDLFNKNYIHYPPQLNSSDNAGVVKKDITDGGNSQVIRYYTTTGKMFFAVRINEVWSEWQELGGQTDTMQFTQANHGFVFTAVTLDGATRKWVKANKYTSADGIAIKIDNDRFDVVTRGVVNIPTSARDDKGEPFVYDEYYFLSQEVDGGLSRTKNEIGTFQYLAHISEIDNKQVAYIDIGDSYDLDYEVVDTETADRVGIGTYKTTLRTADTIEDLKRLNLKEGDVVEVLGYYTKGDGANHKRKIENSDDGSGVLLDNGLYANIIHNGEVCVSWFGVQDEVNILVMEKIIELAIANNLKIFFPKPKIKYNLKKKYTHTDGLITYKDILGNIVLDNYGTYVFSNGTFKDISVNVTKIIYVHPSNYDGISVFQTIQKAFDSIIDNSIRKQYLIKLYPTQTYILDKAITLKNYVSIDSANPSSETKPLITTNYTSGGYGTRDMFKTSLADNPYDGEVSDFEINATFRNLSVYSSEINYTFHLDFNKNEKLNILFENCHLQSLGGSGIGYAVGIGQYNGQKIVFKNCRIIGATVGTKDETDVCAVAWHSRHKTQNNSSYKGLYLEFDNCYVKGDRYALRFVSFDSQNTQDKIVLKNNKLNGTYGDIITFRSNSPKTWFTIDASGNGLKNVNYLISEQDKFSTNFIVEDGYSRFFPMIESDFEFGETVYYSDFYRNKIKRVDTPSARNGAFAGVVLGYDDIHKGYIVQTNGIATVKMFSDLTKYLQKVEVKYDEITSQSGVIATTTGGLCVGVNQIIKTKDEIKYLVKDGYNRISIPSGYGMINIFQETVSSEFVNNFSQLETPTMQYAMEIEGVKQDYLEYSLEKFKYDNQLKEEQKAKYEAYQQALKNNPNLTYEEFITSYPSMIPIIEEPTIPQSVQEFMKKYL